MFKPGESLAAKSGAEFPRESGDGYSGCRIYPGKD
jgi:hypothetical protein